MVDKDTENLSNIFQNYTQALMIFEDSRERNEERLKSFVAEMKKIFAYVDKMETQSEAAKLLTAGFDPSQLAMSVQLVADASEKELYILRKWRDLLINRLNSYTKNKKLIYDIILKYYMQFINCLEEHSSNQILLERLMILSALGLESQTSKSFVDFIKGPVNQMIHKKKAQMEKAMGADSSGGWRANAVGGESD